MKKVFLIPAAIFAVLFLIAAVRLSYNSTEGVTSDAAPSDLSARIAEREPMYVLKEYGDNIAVFLPNSTEPLRVVKEVMLKSLPEYDIALLKTGIKVYSEKELRELLQDYDS